MYGSYHLDRDLVTEAGRCMLGGSSHCQRSLETDLSRSRIRRRIQGDCMEHVSAAAAAGEATPAAAGFLSGVLADPALCVSLLMAALLALYVWGMWRFDRFSAQRLPCLPARPFCGAATRFFLRSTDFHSHVKALYRRARGRPLAGLFHARRPVLLLRDPRLVRRALVDAAAAFPLRAPPPTPAAHALLDKHMLRVPWRRWRAARRELDAALEAARTAAPGAAAVSEAAQRLTDTLDLCAAHMAPGAGVEVRAPLERFWSESLGALLLGVEPSGAAAEVFHRKRRALADAGHSPAAILHALWPGAAQTLNIAPVAVNLEDYFDGLAQKMKDLVKRSWLLNQHDSIAVSDYKEEKLIKSCALWYMIDSYMEDHTSGKKEGKIEWRPKSDVIAPEGIKQPTVKKSLLMRKAETTLPCITEDLKESLKTFSRSNSDVQESSLKINGILQSVKLQENLSIVETEQRIKKKDVQNNYIGVGIENSKLRSEENNKNSINAFSGELSAKSQSKEDANLKSQTEIKKLNEVSAPNEEALGTTNPEVRFTQTTELLINKNVSVEQSRGENGHSMCDRDSVSNMDALRCAMDHSLPALNDVDGIKWAENKGSAIGSKFLTVSREKAASTEHLLVQNGTVQCVTDNDTGMTQKKERHVTLQAPTPQSVGLQKNESEVVELRESTFVGQQSATRNSIQNVNNEIERDVSNVTAKLEKPLSDVNPAKSEAIVVQTLVSDSTVSMMSTTQLFHSKGAPTTTSERTSITMTDTLLPAPMTDTQLKMCNTSEKEIDTRITEITTVLNKTKTDHMTEKKSETIHTTTKMISEKSTGAILKHVVKGTVEAQEATSTKCIKAEVAAAETVTVETEATSSKAASAEAAAETAMEEVAAVEAPLTQVPAQKAVAREASLADAVVAETAAAKAAAGEAISREVSLTKAAATEVDEAEAAGAEAVAAEVTAMAEVEAAEVAVAEAAAAEVAVAQAAVIAKAAVAEAAAIDAAAAEAAAVEAAVAEVAMAEAAMAEAAMAEAAMAEAAAEASFAEAATSAAAALAAQAAEGGRRGALLLGLALRLLSQHPAAQRRAAADAQRASRNGDGRAPYIDAVIAETLRLWPAEAVVGRACVGGGASRARGPLAGGGVAVAVQPGDALWVPAAALHTDHQFWSRPAEFVPERFLTVDECTSLLEGEAVPEGAGEGCDAEGRGVYLPFGLGPRACAGREILLQLAREALLAVLSRLEFHPSAAKKKWGWRWLGGRSGLERGRPRAAKWSYSLEVEGKGFIWLAMKRRSN